MARLSRGLRDSLEASGAIQHALMKGEVRESEVIDALRPHIPARFELASGEAINAQGERSRQQDIIISDALTGTPFLATGGIGVFPVEIVAAVLQVKSSIGAGDVAGAVENVRSVKTVTGDAPRWTVQGMTRTNIITKPFGAILAFQLDGSAQSVATAFRDATFAIDHPLDRCDALVILDRALIAWLDENDNFVLNLFTARRLTLAEGENSFLLFYLLLRAALSNYMAPELQLGHYASGLVLPVTATWSAPPRQA